MKLSKLMAPVFALLGTVLMVGTILVCILSLNAKVQMKQTPVEATARTDQFQEALDAGDLTAVSSLLYGQPVLGAQGTPENAMTAMVWEAFLGSLKISYAGECYATNSGICRDGIVTVLDISSVTDVLAQRTTEVLKSRADAAEDPLEVYDENGQYLPQVVQSAMEEALRQILLEDAVMATHQVTLHVVYLDGQWWISPDNALLTAITGGMA